MKFSVLAVGIIALALGACGSGNKKNNNNTTQVTNPNSYLTFFQYCSDINVNPDIRTTIDALKDRYNERDCRDLDRKLSRARTLRLNGIGIKDLSPFVRFQRIRSLSLKRNKINNLAPLAAMPNLKRLYLDSNTITDLRPLTFLRGLEILDLSKNEVRDLTPLFDLVGLEALDLDRNRIDNVQPLKKLFNLKVLDLRSNPLGRFVQKNVNNCPTDNTTAPRVRRFCSR